MGALENIARWQQKANAREIEFYRPTKQAQEVFSGETPLVLGRKGAGKTALMNFLMNSRKNEANFTRVQFNPTLLRDWGGGTDGSLLSTQDYALRWQAFIFHTICRQAVRDKTIRGGMRDRLSIRYAVTSHSSLGKTLRKTLGGLRKLKVGPTGVEIERGYRPGAMPNVPNNEDWAPYLETCRDDVLQIARNTDKPCVAIFDEIDLTFDPHSDRLQYDEYVNCIKGLLACGSSMNLNAAEAKLVFPIIALRSDIFEAIDGPELSAWNGKKAFLEPDQSTIKQILSFRISHSLGLSESEGLPFSQAWRRVFADDEDFKYIFSRSLNRMRDYVEFMRLAAEEEIAEKKNRKKISHHATTRAYHRFKTFLLAEFVDELYFKYKFGRQLVDAFRLLYEERGDHFTYDKFAECCARMNIELNEIDMRELVRDLFRTSVVGYRVTEVGEKLKPFVYRFEKPDDQLPTEFWKPNVHLGLHRAVRSALEAS